MMNINDICNELQKMEDYVSKREYEIRHIGEMARNSMNRIQADFLDQQPGKTMLNALSLIQVSCENAVNSMEQVAVEANNVLARIKQ